MVLQLDAIKRNEKIFKKLFLDLLKNKMNKNK